MRLIDADVMVRDLKKLSAKQSKRYGQDDISVTMTNAIIADVEAMPTVEPQRIKGRWEIIEDWDGDDLYRCSECLSMFTLIDGTPEDNDYNFCPCCGADMR